MRDFNQSHQYRKRYASKSIPYGWLFLLGILGGFVIIYFLGRLERAASTAIASSGSAAATLSGSPKPDNHFPTRSFALTPLLTPKKTSEDVVRKIGLLTAGMRGKYGWYVEELPQGEVYGSNTDLSFTAASVNKVPIMVTLLLQIEAGNMKLSDTYTLSGADVEDGSGGLQYQAWGTSYSYQELLNVMGKHSDNTAANAMARIIGMPVIQKFVSDQQMLETNLEDNTTSPKDMGGLFSNIYRDKVFNQTSSKQYLFEALTNTDFEDRIPAGVPDGTVVVHKIGNQIQVLNDCGIVMGPSPYTLCIFTQEAAEDEANEVIPQISREVWNFEKDRR